MEKEQSRSSVLIGNKQVPMHGKFRLTIRRDPSKFHLTNLGANIPMGKDISHMDHFYGVNGPVAFMLFDKVQTFLKPDTNDIDAKNVAVLIRHPDVRLEDMTDAEHEQLVKQGIKKANPLFTLVNLDKSSVDNHNDEVEMIEINYLITKKKDGLSKRKLMYICSAVGLSTRSEHTDETRYIAYLQQQLMTYLKSDKSKRAEFLYFHEKVQDAEILYFINEFIEMGIIQDFGGMYKIKDQPVGYSIPDIKEWLGNNEDRYEQYKLEVNQYHNGKVTS